MTLRRWSQFLRPAHDYFLRSLMMERRGAKQLLAACWRSIRGATRGITENQRFSSTSDPSALPFELLRHSAAKTQ
jgi:hypothetical protein